LRIPALAVVLILLAIRGALAADLKIATWNLNWLTAREAGLPSDVKLREPDDFERLRSYAAELNADITAIQEVDNAEIARRIFPPELYSVHMSRDHVRQRVGIVVRRGLPYEVNPDVTAIALDPEAHLRSGVDITVRLPSGPLRVLAVHLKQGCQYLTFGGNPQTTCVTLMTQFDIVAQWIAARRDEGVPFFVMGDFNRGLDRNDPFNRKIRGSAVMIRATEGYSSPCWGHESFIDHILIGGAARDWVEPGSLKVLAYRETGSEWKARLSDHCPVSVRLAVPD
jgi:exonuclease III